MKQQAEVSPSPSSRRGLIADDIVQVETLFSFRVSVLAKLLDRRLARLVGEQFGLALAEYRVLAQITMQPKSTVRAIAALTFVDKAQVSRAVAVLEEQDLIARATPAADRRSPLFTATRAGRALMGRIIPLRQAQERELAARLGRSETASLAATFESLIDALTEPNFDAEVEPTATQRRRAIRTERVQRSKERSRLARR